MEPNVEITVPYAVGQGPWSGIEVLELDFEKMTAEQRTAAAKTMTAMKVEPSIVEKALSSASAVYVKASARLAKITYGSCKKADGTTVRNCSPAESLGVIWDVANGGDLFSNAPGDNVWCVQATQAANNACAMSNSAVSGFDVALQAFNCKAATVELTRACVAPPTPAPAPVPKPASKPAPAPARAPTPARSTPSVPSFTPNSARDIVCRTGNMSSGSNRNARAGGSNRSTASKSSSRVPSFRCSSARDICCRTGNMSRSRTRK